MMMHNPESALENETQKILLDFKIQTDHPISARRPDQVIVNNNKKKKEKKENLGNSGLCRSICQQDKLKENEKRDKHLDLAREQKKNMEQWYQL